jgi:transcriptional regulator with XRE-family HTH domain
MQATLTPSFESEFSRWRKHRKISQLDLSLEANVSQRHISYLETGRSKPSRDMLIKLCDVLLIPFRERNYLLSLAGYSAIYKERSLDTPAMQPVLKALDSMLTAHNPLPAIVVDRFWTVIKQNDAASKWFNLVLNRPELKPLLEQETSLNVALLSLHPDGLRQFITNWEQVVPAFVRRLQQELNESGDQAVKQRLVEYLNLSGLAELPDNSYQEDLTPILPLNMRIDGQDLSMFSIISTIGTPQDITADELRVESFYPADEQTTAFFDELMKS